MPIGGGNTGGVTGAAIRAGRAFVEFWADDSRFSRTLSDVKRRVQGLGSFISKTGIGLAALGGGLLAPLKPILDSLGEGGKLANAADAFGLTADEASRLFGIMKASGSDLRDATEGIVTLNQRISDALAGTGDEARQLFADLGRGPESFGGNSADKFYQFVEALKAVPDPAKRVQLLLKGVGEDTGKNLIPLLSMSSDRIREMGDAFALTAEDLQAQREASAAYSMAVAGLGAVWQQVVTAVAPAVKELAATVSAVVRPIAQWVRENPGLVTGVLAVGAALVAGGTAAIAFGTALSGVAAVAGVAAAAVGGLMTLLLTPGGLLTAGIVAVGSQLIGIGNAVEFLRRGLGELADTAALTFGGVSDALKAGELELATKVAFAGVNVEWRKAVKFWTEAWVGFKDSFVDGWHAVADGVKIIVNNLASYITGKISKAFHDIFGPAAEILRKAPGLGALSFAVDQGLKATGRFADPAAVERGRQAREDEILADAARRADANRKLREAQRVGAADAVKAAQEELDALREQAARGGPQGANAALTAGIGAGLAALTARARSGLAAADAVKGGFDATLASRVFALGDSVQQKQLKAQEQIARNAEELPAMRKGIDLLQVALRLK